MSDPIDANPFADPTVQRASQNVQLVDSALNDYNPFAQKNVQTKPAAIIPTASTTSISGVSPQVATSSQPKPQFEAAQPPPYAQSSAQKVSLNDIEKQQQELERRAAELDRRERLLSSGQGGEAKNFPPMPSWCPGPLQPCFYQDISREIPVEFQRWVRLLFYLWLFHTFTLAFNIIAALVVFITMGSGATFGFSILYFVLFTPLTYICWFRPAYKGFRSDSSINFMMFFFVFFIQIIVNVIETVGFKDSGFCGLILLISVLSTTSVNNVVAGIFVLLATMCFVGIAVSDILMLIKIHRLYRGTSASFEKAQRELATNVMSNKNVQSAATAVITESARNAFQQPGAGQPSYGSPGRF